METKADFIGFKFAGTHSSDLGIIRTSDGDRFNEQLVPEIKDNTVEVPGMHGEYFFGSTYGTRTFEVPFAFDNLTEEQFRKLRQVYGQRQIGELIFDERPYKKYMAKIASPIELSYICFDQPKRRVVGTNIGDERYGIRVKERVPITETIIDEDTQEEIEVETGEYSITRERIYPYETEDGTERIYKGEGKIEFVCYFPFGKSTFKWLTDEEENSDWAVSSGLMTSTEYAEIDKYVELVPATQGETEDEDTPAIYGMRVYNAGDVEVGFRLYVPSSATSNAITLIYSSYAGADFSDILKINPIELKPNDVGYLIDTNNNLIIGVSSEPNSLGSDTTSGNLYNQFIDSGNFFKLKPNPFKENISILQIDGGNENIQIFYDYLYF